MLIVFTLFLLITILLLLLLSNAKEKSNRIRVLVILPGNPIDSEILEVIKSFLANLAAEDNFAFTIADETNQPDGRFPVSYPVILYMRPYHLTGEWEAVSVNPADSGEIHIATGPDAFLCHDPEFSMQVRNAILKASSMKRKAG